MESLGRSGHALGTLLNTLDILGCSGVLWHVLGMFWECFWMLWSCSGNTLGTICARVEDNLESAGNDFEISFRLGRAI